MNTSRVRKFDSRHLAVAAVLALMAPLAAQAAQPSIYAGGETAYTDFPTTPSTRTRADVKAEVLQARRDGSLDAIQTSQQSPANRLVGADRKSRQDVAREARDLTPAQRAARAELYTGA